MKPANIFLSETGAVKLGDFGLSRSFTSSTTLSSTVCGTPYYLSPEQVDFLLETLTMATFGPH